MNIFKKNKIDNGYYFYVLLFFSLKYLKVKLSQH